MFNVHPLIAAVLLIALTLVPQPVFGQVLPNFGQATFLDNAPIDNPYFPLVPGTVFTYEGVTPDGTERIETTVTLDTKEILGVEATVIRDRAWLDDVLIEDTFDWYAQDTDGNVWYLGEFTTAYEYDDFGVLVGTNNDGSWEAGVDAALPGWRMEANPQIGDSYYQEYAVGIAEDEGEVLSLTESVSGPQGDFQNVLKILDSTQLDTTVLEHKLYASGVGLVRVEEELDEMGDPAFILDLVGVTQLEDDDEDGDEGEEDDEGQDSDDSGDDDGDGDDGDDSDENADDGDHNNGDGDDGGDADDGDDVDGGDGDDDDAGDDELDDDGNGESTNEITARIRSGKSRADSNDHSKAKSPNGLDSVGAVALRLGLAQNSIVSQLISTENGAILGFHAEQFVEGSESVLDAQVQAIGVPEPASLVLSLVGLAPLWWKHRVRK